MSIAQWYVSRGRITRRAFWLYYVLPLVVLGILASVIDLAMGFAELETTTTASGATGYFSMGPVGIAVTLITLVPSISSTVTRLHDQDKSAVWLLFLLLPLIGWFVLLVLTGFIPGTPGPNKYGPPPAGDRVHEPGYPASYS